MMSTGTAVLTVIACLWILSTMIAMESFNSFMVKAKRKIHPASYLLIFGFAPCIAPLVLYLRYMDWHNARNNKVNEG